MRYGYDDSIFPGYSWRGYAVLSRIQVRADCYCDNLDRRGEGFVRFEEDQFAMVMTIQFSPGISGGDMTCFPVSR